MRKFAFILIPLLLGSCKESEANRIERQDEIAQIDRCDNPDADIGCCFENMPSSLSNTVNIADNGEPGEKLIISGTIFKGDGKTPYPNIILYCFHTDNKGYYSKNGTERGVQKWHGKLHGWCKTDADGKYEIQTIKPARYPDNSMPAHIHAAVKKDDGEMYWINDFVFKNDDLVNEKYLKSLEYVGGNGVVDIQKNTSDAWIGTRDIVLTK